MKLYTSGIKVHKLGSPQDRVIRQYLVKVSEKEIAKTQLMAMLVSNSISFATESSAREWTDRVRKVFTNIMGLEYGIEVPEFSDVESKMIKEYQTKVKHLKPKLKRDAKGRFTVTGLDSMKE